jgi:hypothetical protein
MHKGSVSQGYYCISHSHVADFIYIMHEVHPRYEQGYVIHCVANLKEENSFLSLFELGAGLWVPEVLKIKVSTVTDTNLKVCSGMRAVCPRAITPLYLGEGEGKRAESLLTLRLAYPSVSTHLARREPLKGIVMKFGLVEGLLKFCSTFQFWLKSGNSTEYFTWRAIRVSARILSVTRGIHSYLLARSVLKQCSRGKWNI